LDSKTCAREDENMVKVAPSVVRHRGAAFLAAAFAVSSLLLAGASAAIAANAPALRLIKTIPINGTAGNPNQQMFSFDISWVDPANGLYYLADRSNKSLDVVDTTGAFTGRPDSLFGQIGGGSVGFAGDTGNTATSGPDGVTAAFPCIFAGDGTSRLITFNGSVSFTTVVSSVSTGGQFRVDEMAYDPKDGILMAANNADTPPFGTLFTINKSTCAASVLAKTTFNSLPGGHVATNGAEQSVWDPTTQAFYIAIPEVDGPGGGGPHGGVAQVSTSGAVTNFYPINFCQPGGLAVGPNDDLIVGCSTPFDLSGNPCTAAVANGKPATCTGQANPQVAICNPGRGCTGNALVAVPGPGGGDELYFNAGDGNYYVTGGNNPVGPTLGVVASGATATPNVMTQLVPTLQPIAAVTGVHGAGTVHSVAASAASNHIYVPLPANTAYPNCAQGCIGVFASQNGAFGQ